MKNMNDDLISRQAAIDALQNHYEVRNPKQNAIMDECVMLISNVPSVQTEKMQLSKEDATKGTTFDCISRQAAIDAIHEWGLIDGLAEGQAIEILSDEEKVPSVQPEHTETHSCDCERTGTHDSRREWYMKGYRDAQRWIPCEECEKRCEKWENSKT